MLSSSTENMRFMEKLKDGGIRISRGELYKLAWEKSVSKFSTEYGLSVDQVRKVCKEFQIPLPSSGYWSKLKFGKSVVIDPLPEIPSGNPEIVLNEQKSVKSIVVQDVPKELKTVPEKLSKPCSEAIALRDDMKEKKPRPYHDRKGVIESSNGVFDVAVSKSNIGRSVRIVDSFLKLAKELGYDVRFRSKTEICVDGQWLKVRIREKSKRLEVENSRGWKETRLELTGDLAFQMIDTYYEREWKDGKVTKLEDSFHKIMPWLRKKAAERNVQKEESRKWHEGYMKKREEEEARKRLIQQEKDNFKLLLTLSEKVRLAKEIRSVVNLAEESKVVPVGFYGWQFEEWVKWAKAKADWCDPFVSRGDRLLTNEDLEEAITREVSIKSDKNRNRFGW